MARHPTRRASVNRHKGLIDISHKRYPREIARSERWLGEILNFRPTAGSDLAMINGAISIYVVCPTAVSSLVGQAWQSVLLFNEAFSVPIAASAPTSAPIQPSRRAIDQEDFGRRRASRLGRRSVGVCTPRSPRLRHIGSPSAFVEMKRNALSVVRVRPAIAPATFTNSHSQRRDVFPSF